MDTSPQQGIDFVIVDIQTLPDGALVALVVHLLNRTGSQKPHKQVALPAWRLQRVIEYVETHLQENFGVTALAGAAGLSVRHFTRAFSQEVGETPRRWLMNRRIEHAKLHLTNSELTLTQIAHACGLGPLSHFSRAFRRITGESPQRWRQTNKKI
jgi:AraC family transcriptional regulator